MRKLFFPLLLFVSGLLSAQTEITLYVSPSGSDHHPGTAEKPMATLEYAWKKASRQAGRRSITIYCEGTNYLSAPILITNETSGTPEHPIRFSSYPGQKAVISGSRILRNLRWKEYKNGIMQTKVEEELIPDQLFVNGKNRYRHGIRILIRIYASSTDMQLTPAHPNV